MYILKLCYLSLFSPNRLIAAKLKHFHIENTNYNYKHSPILNQEKRVKVIILATNWPKATYRYA